MYRLLLLAALVLVAGPALAQTCTRSWAAPVDGSWSVATNWIPAEVPTAGDVACITAAGTYIVSLAQGLQQRTAVTAVVLGGPSGVQTLSTATYFSADNVTVGPNGRWAFLNRTPGGDDGLYATGTVTVEGEVSVPGGVTFLRNSGTLDVAPSGTLRVSGGASVGGVNSLFRVRGTLEGVGCPFPANTGQCNVRAPVEVLGGTLRATSGVLQFQAGGTMNDATLDVRPDSDLRLSASLAGPPYQYTVEGTIDGTPEGYVAWQGVNVAAGAAGATFDVGGTGLQLQGSSLTSGGGSFTNTGLLREAVTGSNFSGFRGVTIRNTGTVEFPAGFEFYDGAVLRNEPGATVLFSAGNGLSGDGRFENAGLLLRDGNRPAIGATVGFGGLLRSLPGSEIRILADTQVNLDAPGTDTLPEGVTVTGVGVVGLSFALDPEGTISPGTAAQPLAALTVANYFRPNLTAGDPRLVIDVDAGGRSDTLAVLFAPGSQNTRLGGTLVVRVRTGYVPSLGDTFTVLTSGSAIEGQFAQIVVEGAPDGLTFAAETSPDGLSVLLRAMTAVASAGTPKASALALRVYPNPAYRASAVALDHAEAGPIHVEVVDGLGRRVAVLHDGPLAAGAHVLQLDAGALSPGVYVVRAVAETSLVMTSLTVVR